MTTRYGETINKTGLTIKARAPQAGLIPQDTTGLGATNMAGTDTFNALVSKELPPPLISVHRPFLDMDWNVLSPQMQIDVKPP